MGDETQRAWEETHYHQPSDEAFDGFDAPGGPGRGEKENGMAGVWKKIDVVGTSPASFAEATKVAVAEAAKSVRHMGWFEVVEMRGAIQGGDITEFQVTVRIGFKLEA